MDKLAASCNDALDYPRNLIQPGVHEFALESFYDRLDPMAPRLFHTERKAAVVLLEFADGRNGKVIGIHGIYQY